MASDEWRKQLNPDFAVAPTRELRRNPFVRSQWAGRFKVQCSKFKVGDAAVER